jgi:hypothetical protein
MELNDLDAGRFSIGKAAVFYADAWDFDSDLNNDLEFLGFTEGEVGVAFNETFNSLTLPEYTGDAPHKSYVQGEAPVATIPLFTADPSLRAILSPTGTSSGGLRRQRPVQEYTLVFVPEELFLDLSDPDAQTELTLSATGSGWELGGVALTPEQEETLAQSVFLWRGMFTKPPLTYRHEEGGKSVDEVTFTVMYQVLAPNGNRLYTIGDPYDAGIDITSGVVES